MANAYEGAQLPSGLMGPVQLILRQRQSLCRLPGVRDSVYVWCMARTNVDVDEKACAEVMRRFGLTTKRAAVNFALRTLAAEPLSVDEARRMRGTGWEGDLAEMRAARVS